MQSTPHKVQIDEANSLNPRFIGYYDLLARDHLVPEIPPASLASLTHVVVTNALRVDNKGGIHIRPKKNPKDVSTPELIQNLVKLPPRIVVSMRGHPDDVALDELSEQPAIRERFVTDMAVLLRKWGVAGLEIEWHSDDPGGGKAATEPFDDQERKHFSLLCRDLAGILGAAGGRTLSIAVRPGRKELDGHFAQHYVDWLTVRAYSMRSLGDPHPASLKDMKVALDEWTAKGVSRNKLVLGMPLFARPSGALHRADDRNEELRRTWKEIAGHDEPTVDIKGDAFVDQKTGKVWWVSGLTTTQEKVQHVLQNMYGGVAFRDLHQDSNRTELSLVQVASDTLKKYRKSLQRQRSPLLGQPPTLFQRGATLSHSEGDGLKRDEF